MEFKRQKTIIVRVKDKGKRLDIFLTEQLDLTRSEIKNFIKAGLVFINGVEPKKAGQALRAGDKVLVKPKEKRKEGRKVNPKIISETDDYIVIDKPSGILVHPTDAKEENTIANWFIGKYPDVEGVGEDIGRSGIVHRLDKDVSGVMVLAKNQKMYDFLKKQFKERATEKEYGVLVHETLALKHDTIDFEINRGTDGRMAARPKIDSLKLKNVGKEQHGRTALTEFWVEKEYARFSLLKAKIYSGRTHQIRVHMLSYGHPIVGDTLYFNKKLNRKRDLELKRLFLYAKRLCFLDLNKEKVCFEVKMPKLLKDFLKDLN